MQLVKKYMRIILWTLLIFVEGIVMVTYGGNAGPVQAAVPMHGAVTSNRAVIHYAKGFTLEYHAGYKILRVLSPWRGARATFTYVLVPRGAKHPPVEKNAMLVETPVRRIVVTSNTFMAYFAMLGLEDRIVGVTGAGKVGTPSVAARIRAGRIMEIGNASVSNRHYNMELLLELHPDLIMINATGNPQTDQTDKLREAGFTLAINGSYMDTTPLGHTEWMKFIAAFFDKDAEAERQFAVIAHRYEAMAARARKVKFRPSVFCGPCQGGWYMPGGNSYTAAFLRDAGAQYLWLDDRSTGNIPLNTETVVARAREAEFCINALGTYRSLAEMAGADERYTVFRAFRTGQVYGNNAKLNAGGGNDFWETGVAHPDRVLADLISIFHPELFPKYQRTWFWRLPARAQAHR